MSNQKQGGVRLAFFLGLCLLQVACLAASVPQPTDQTYMVSGRVIDHNRQGVADIGLDLGKHGMTTTNADGYWQASQLQGTVTVTPAHDVYVFYPSQRSIDGPSLNLDFFAGDSPEPATLNILAITDTHLQAGADDQDPPSGGIGPLNNYYATPANLRHMLDIVNDTADGHLLVHLGDICEPPDDWDYFLHIWNQVQIPTEIAIGNHDFDGSTYEELSAILSYDGRPELGGSVFNKSFAIGEEPLKARVIIIDTNYDQHNQHTNPVVGRYSDAGLQWIAHELEMATEPVILFFSHHAPHHYNHPAPSPLFNTASAMAFKGIVETAMETRPELRMHYFHGHWHGAGLEVLHTLGPGIPAYRVPATVHTERGYLARIRVDVLGEVDIAIVELEYPYGQR